MASEDAQQPVSGGEALGEAVPAPGEAAAAPSARPGPPRNLYFIRVPRPHLDDAPVKELQVKLTATLTKLKEYNAKLAAKREVVSGLRGQVAVARSLKEEAAPEWQDKITKLQELKEIRKNYQEEISAIKAGQSGLDVKSEAELDAKVAEMEAEISHGSMGLREEKQMVRDIARIKAQRERVREFEGRRGALTQLEGELVKVKAAIKELDTEVSSLRGERSQAVGILQEIQGKLREVNDSIAEIEAERSQVEAKKKELQDKIRSVQDESSGAMQEWRENRKFSLAVRDLVEAGKLDEARGMCSEQVATYMARLVSDAVYRMEYTAGWAEQRKYVVSELLPGSGVPQGPDARRGGDKAAKGGEVGSGDKGPKPEPKVQGAAKAAALIEQLMQQAHATAAAVRAAAPPPPLEAESSGETGEDAPAAAAADAGAGAEANGGQHRAPAPGPPRAVPGASDELLASKKAGKPKAGGGAAKQVVEVPEVPDVEVDIRAAVAPRAGEDEGEAGMTEAEKKAAIREEQRRKAAEAEARKKKREETAVKKKQAAEARRAEEAAAPPPPPPAAAVAAAPLEEAAAAASSGDDAEGVGGAGAPQQQRKQKSQQKVQPRKPKGAAIIKPVHAAVPLKRVKGEEPAWRKAWAATYKSLGLKDTVNQVVAAVALLFLLLVLVSLISGGGARRGAPLVTA